MKITKKLIILFSLFFTIFILAGCESSFEVSVGDTQPVNSKYSNSEYKFELEYPSNYSEDTSYEMPILITIKSPLEDTSDTYTDMLNVTVGSPNGMTLLEYNNYILGAIPTAFENGSVVSNGKTTLGGNPAYKTIFTGVQDGFNLKWTMVYSLVGEEMYTVTVLTEESKYDMYAEDMTKIIDSFKFVE